MTSGLCPPMPRPSPPATSFSRSHYIECSTAGTSAGLPLRDPRPPSRPQPASPRLPLSWALISPGHSPSHFLHALLRCSHCFGYSPASLSPVPLFIQFSLMLHSPKRSPLCAGPFTLCAQCGAIHCRQGSPTPG